MNSNKAAIVAANNVANLALNKAKNMPMNMPAPNVAANIANAVVNKANKMNNIGSAVVANAVVKSAQNVKINTKPTTAALNIAKAAVKSAEKVNKVMNRSTYSNVPMSPNANKKLTPNNFFKKPEFVKFNEGNGKTNAQIYKQGVLKNVYKNSKGKYVKSSGNLGNLKNYLFSGLMV